MLITGRNEGCFGNEEWHDCLWGREPKTIGRIERRLLGAVASVTRAADHRLTRTFRPHSSEVGSSHRTTIVSENSIMPRMTVTNVRIKFRKSNQVWGCCTRLNFLCGSGFRYPRSVQCLSFLSAIESELRLLPCRLSLADRNNPRGNEQ